MNINATLFGQTIAFFVFVWFCMKFVWPPIMNALNIRKQTIADGLAAGERGKREQQLAEERAKNILVETKTQVAEILARAEKRGGEIIEEAKADARAEGVRILAAARADIKQELNSAKEVLRAQVSNLAIIGASKVLEREVDAGTHSDLLSKLASQI